MNYLMTLLASALGSCALGSPDGEVPVLTPEVFIETARADSTAFILDVRDQPTFIEGIKHFDKKRTYYLYCRSGKRSNAAATYMQAEGFRVRDMEGGYMRWTAEGRPVAK